MKQSLRARLRADDPEAFRQLYQELGQVIYAHAYRATGDWSAAEDAVSLTFLEVWRLRERLEQGDESLRPWVYGIATNVLRNRGRAARKHQQTLTRFPTPETVPDIADEVAARIDDSERLAAARAAVARLRRGDRDVYTYPGRSPGGPWAADLGGSKIPDRVKLRRRGWCAPGQPAWCQLPGRRACPSGQVPAGG
ncbi:RNA polymerase sigma factor [Streptomyces sp. NBC_01483]|uniref:RNA polymerase sigma factor n=1 Tax=Streptomyces sp. NBC_01483 TaxID=2903883 RepID=UPI002E3612CB|nr:sigma-70 family RNA polymerase sigma factor [Streptomyces sp. NBC_01483]